MDDPNLRSRFEGVVGCRGKETRQERVEIPVQEEANVEPIEARRTVTVPRR